MTIYDYIDQLSDGIEDFDYSEQQAIITMGVMPEEYEAACAPRMAEILQARAKKDRPISGFDWMNTIGRRRGGK